LLFETFGGKAYIDYSELKTKKKKIDQRLEREPIKDYVLSEESEKELQKFRELLSAKRYSSNTVGTYVNCLKMFFGYFGEEDVKRISNSDVNRFMHEVVERGNYSLSYHRQIIGAIELYYGRLRERNLNLDKLERPRKARTLPKVLAKEEIKAILDKCANLKHKTMISLQYGCGLRVGELLDLKLSDISKDRKTLTVRQGKGKKDRRIPLSNSLLEMLGVYCGAYQPDNQLFEGKNGGRYSMNSVNQFLKKYADAAGIKKDINSHMLRHSYATHLMESGVGLRYIQEALGHASSRTTEIYTYVSTSEMGKLPSPIDFLNDIK
jgi:integrase/recombinase XerD